MQPSIIIQARMGSRRFPKKTIAKLGSFMVLEWIFKRLKSCKKVKHIILATTTKSEDDILCKIADKNQILCFRGSEKDVLGRYIDAANFFSIDKIIRVCADRPFVDPKLIDDLAMNFDINRNHLIYNHRSDKNNFWPIGFGGEIVTLNTLKKIYSYNLNDEFKEHVTLFLYDNPDYEVKCMHNNYNITIKERFDLDTLSDYKKLLNLSNIISLNDDFQTILDKFETIN